MRPNEAMALLGIDADQAAEPGLLRAAYRREIRSAHPDLNPAADASRRAADLSAAYRLLLELEEAAADRRNRMSRPGARPNASPAAPSPPPKPPPAPRVRAKVLDATTVQVEGTREQAFAALLEASHRLGEIGYLDRGSALLEVIVEFVQAPTSSLVMSLQGRAAGVVEVFCAVEPLSGGESPPIEAVTRLLAETLSDIEMVDLAI